MICIVDYGSGNVAALMNVLKRGRIAHFLSGDPHRFAEADRFILPGVGAFDPTMERLRGSGILEGLTDQVIGRGKPVLGICVGMHLLAQGSDEGVLPGLGWIAGRVRRIETGALAGPPLLPHMGWNSISPTVPEGLFRDVDCSRGFYFLHSYFFDAAIDADISAQVDYGGSFACAVARENISGVQFHPEKSHRNGTALLHNFAEGK